VVLNRLDDLRITQVRPLLPPAILLEEIPITERASELVSATRQAIANVLSGQDPRLVLVVGPCSIHDTKAAVEYAERLLPLKERYAGELIVTMRSYFEKPRTSVGWKGLINDPDIDESFHINKGLRLARQLLVDLNDMGLPTASEFLDTQIPQYIADLTSWVAIGARTTESQVHRELASGLSMPVGFKNGTDGSTQTAVDAVLSARSPHLFPSVTKQGVSAIFETSGNDTCHVILRGGSRSGPNFDASHVDEVCTRLKARGLPEKVMIDCSHGNRRITGSSRPSRRRLPSRCAPAPGA
jgi:3-deoxy-7-phosphoheptulonate synthase